MCIVALSSIHYVHHCTQICIFVSRACAACGRAVHGAVVREHEDEQTAARAAAGALACRVRARGAAARGRALGRVRSRMPLAQPPGALLLLLELLQLLQLYRVDCLADAVPISTCKVQ